MPLLGKRVRKDKADEDQQGRFRKAARHMLRSITTRAAEKPRFGQVPQDVEQKLREASNLALGGGAPQLPAMAFEADNFSAGVHGAFAAPTPGGYIKSPNTAPANGHADLKRVDPPLQGGCEDISVDAPSTSGNETISTRPSTLCLSTSLSDSGRGSITSYESDLDESCAKQVSSLARSFEDLYLEEDGKLKRTIQILRDWKLSDNGVDRSTAPPPGQHLESTIAVDDESTQPSASAHNELPANVATDGEKENAAPSIHFYFDTTPDPIVAAAFMNQNGENDHAGAQQAPDSAATGQSGAKSAEARGPHHLNAGSQHLFTGVRRHSYLEAEPEDYHVSAADLQPYERHSRARTSNAEGNTSAAAATNDMVDHNGDSTMPDNPAGATGNEVLSSSSTSVPRDGYEADDEGHSNTSGSSAGRRSPGSARGKRKRCDESDILGVEHGTGAKRRQIKACAKARTWARA